tara:strand:- start:14 stop:889 length:876 start_codon:yes stop_codon:yes gene_type:complete
MLQQHKIQRYRTLIESENVLPIGWGKDKKAPCLSGWQLNPKFTLEEICSVKDCIALGITTQNLFVLDLDGQSSIRWGRNKGLLDSGYTWEVHRTSSPYYYKRIFRPTSAQLAVIPENQDGLSEFQFRVRTNPSNFLNEAAEFFLAHNRQIIFYGKHWKSGGDYFSPPHRDFGDVREPTDKEWKVVVEELTKRQEKLPPNSRRSNSSDWFTLDVCPVCGRDQHNICQMHRDEKTVRCFEGVTYHPPQNLRPGEVIHDNWAYVRSQYVGWGDFSIFVQHNASPVEKLRRRLYV